MITTVGLLHTSITSHNYHFFCDENTYCLSNFQVYNTVLLPIVIMLYIRSPELIDLITASLYPLTNISPFPPLLRLGRNYSTLCSMGLAFLDFTYK